MDNDNRQDDPIATPQTEAERELAQYVADNRKAVDMPKRLQVEVPELLSAERAAEREAATQRRAELRRKAELNQRFFDLVNAAGSRYRDCTLQTFRCVMPEQSNVVAAIREYINADFPGGLVLYGPVGTGKDHLAFAVCRAAIRAGKTVRWINGQNWFGLVRDAMDTSRSEASLIADLARPDMLCLSDPLPPSVGERDGLTPHQATMLYRLIDARYSRGVPTICTVNVLDDAEADERMGTPTWDRLTHDAWKLKCDWPTHRRPAREVY